MHFPFQQLLLQAPALRSFWLALLILLAFFGCKQNNEALKDQEAARPIALTLCHGSITNILPHLALSQGYFAEEGLQVSIREMDGKKAFDGLGSGECNFAVSGPPPIATADHTRNSFTILATILEDDDATQIVARRDHGIASPSDLRGKRIAIKRGTHSNIFLDKFLRAHGLKASEINLVDLELPEMLKALTTGDIDAFSMTSNLVHDAAEKLGDRAVIFSMAGLNASRAILTTRPDVPMNREKTPGMLKALIKAEKYAAKNPTAAKKSLLKNGQGLTEEEVNSIWKRATIEVTLSNSLLLCLEEQFRWQTAQDKTKAPGSMPNYLDFISPGYLKAIKPDAASVLAP